MSYPADSDVPEVEKHVLTSPLKFDPWLAAVLACFTLLAWVSWGKLAHLLVDTGNEVEITARLLAGQLLYRDLETHYGPFAYYTNALALLLFGHHLEVFYAVGLILALAATLLVYHLAKRLTDVRWAALCTLNVLIYCAFSPGGLVNFIAPYTYGAVYAMVLCLLAFTVLDRYGHTGRAGWLVVAAIACGLAGLAKQEYGVAALAGVLVGANLCSPKNLRARVRRSVLIILVASACVLLPLALLTQQVSWEKLYISLVPISSPLILTDSGLFDFSPAKTLNIWRNTFKIFVATSLVVWGSIVTAHWISRPKWIPGDQWIRVLIEILASIALALVGLVLLRISVWQNTFKIFFAASLVAWGSVVAARWISRPEWIPDSRWLRTLVKVLAGITIAGFSWFILRKLACCSDVVFHPLGNMAWLLPLLVGWFALSWRELVQDRHAPLLWTLLVFSVLLNARFWFYINFYGLYAVTAVLLFFTLLYHLALRTGAPVGQFLLVCLLIGGGMNLAEFGQYRYAVHSTQGTVYTKNADRALAFNQTIRYINSFGSTSVLVVPVGAIMNFLTATHSPSRETIFLPGILPTAEAEREFLARIQDNPPDLIVYVDFPFSWLKKGYHTYAEFNPLIDHWITHQHRLVYVSSKLLDFNKEWTIRVYARD